MKPSYVFAGSLSLCEPLSARLSEAGYPLAPSVREADLVFVLAADTDALEELFLGSESLVSRAREGAVLAMLSLCPPLLAREIEAVATVEGALLVAAPLHLADPLAPGLFADRGNVAAFVGGRPEAVARVREPLAALASSLHEVGGVQEAQAVKCASVLVRGTRVLGSLEAAKLACATAERLERPALLEALLASGSLSAEDASLAAALRAGDFEGGMPVDLLRGEVEGALQASEDAQAALPLADATRHLLALLSLVGGAQLNLAGLSLLFEGDEAGSSWGLDWHRAEGHAHDHAGHHHEHGDDDELGLDEDLDDEDWSWLDEEEGYGFDRFSDEELEDDDYDDDEYGYDGSRGGLAHS